MKHLLALLLALLPVGAQAQQVPFPPPSGTVGIVCSYNAGAQTVTTGNFALVQCDSSGRLVVNGNTNVLTYGSAVTGLANTGAGDVYCIRGSATKLVKIKGIRVSATATASAVIDATIVLRSAAGTGGTSTSPGIIPHDSTNPASTSLVTAYSVSPTPGTAIGTIRTQKISVGTAGNTAFAGLALYQFTTYWDQPLILRGTTQYACVNFTAAGAGASINIDHEHTEE